ncbi:GDP-mannose 4,6-dehydratase [Coxiella burnetii]|uniref:GDP-mannose 4,6-dehydratase n=1 Tax=Coxiella burnetii TaxID=777 RepID=UPI00223113AE|nr:GDP-mannose 4,6-dehydratase [Coxiella burnetii]
MMRKPIAIVTGGAGFIGSHMVDLLLDCGFQVRVIDNLKGGHRRNLEHRANNPDLTFEIKDICELSAPHPLFENVDYVFHFAGIGDIVPSIENPIDYLQTNVMGTVRVLECARAANVKKLVYAASSSCYGLADVPTREDHPIAPQYPYALSKYLGEEAAFHWFQVYGLPVNSIRIFNAYGTRVRTTGVYGAVFGVFFKQKLADKPFTVVGDGTQRRDFLYVTDVARAFLKAAETRKVGETWNLGAGNPQSINRLVELIGGEVEYIPKRPGEPDCTWADISKIKRDLGWEPTITFADGVSRMMSEIGVWHDAPLWNKESIANATATWFKYLGKNKKEKADVAETILS